MILHLPSLDAAATAAFVPAAAFGCAGCTLAAFALALVLLRSNRHAELSGLRALLGVGALLLALGAGAQWALRAPALTEVLQHRYAPAAAAAASTLVLLGAAGMQLRRKAGKQPSRGRLLAGLLLSACASLTVLTAVGALVFRMP